MLLAIIGLFMIASPAQAARLCHQDCTNYNIFQDKDGIDTIRKRRVCIQRCEQRNRQADLLEQQNREMRRQTELMERQVEELDDQAHYGGNNCD